MKSPVRIVMFFAVLAAFVLAACAPAATPAADYTSDQAQAVAATAAPAATEAPAAQDAAGGPAQPAAKAGVGGAAGGGAANSVDSGSAATAVADAIPQSPGDRKIIKNADLKLQVADTDSAIDRTTQIVGDVGGYILSSRIWFQDYNNKSYKYASISMGVPVDQFETAMRRLRGLAVKVLDENASGQDVTDQYVDLQSQLDSLQATRDRIKGFLDQAKTVDEALQINQQLTDVEGQIDQVKGKMNYLSGRSAYSTISVSLEPQLPDIPTLTPTPTRTLTPTPTPTVWSPGNTFNSASNILVNSYEGITELLIWVFVVLVPILLPPVLIIWLIWKLVTRKNKKPTASS